MNRLAGKRVLITGASAGIGEACAQAFAERGADLLLSARRVARVEELAERISEEHDVHVHTARLDVTDSGAVASYVEEIATANLVPDILLNNAGKAVGLDLLHEGSLDDWEDMIDTNIKGYFMCLVQSSHTWSLAIPDMSSISAASQDAGSTPRARYTTRPSLLSGPSTRG